VFAIDNPPAPYFARALATPGPVLIEAVVDQHTAMLPAKITPGQAIVSAVSGKRNRLLI
jgi:thiamine pyrophosphate-dependent acetolactate synthase large subunit-like protein